MQADIHPICQLQRNFIKGPFSAITNSGRVVQNLTILKRISMGNGNPRFCNLSFGVPTGQPERASRIFGHAVSQ